MSYVHVLPQVLLSDVSEVSSVVVGVASHDKDGRQSSVTSTTYHQTTSSQHHQSDQYRLVRHRISDTLVCAMRCSFYSAKFGEV